MGVLLHEHPWFVGHQILAGLQHGFDLLVHFTQVAFVLMQRYWPGEGFFAILASIRCKHVIFLHLLIHTSIKHVVGFLSFDIANLSL